VVLLIPHFERDYNLPTANIILRLAIHVANESEDVFGTPVSKAAQHVPNRGRVA